MAEKTLKGKVITPFGRLTFGILLGYSCMMVGLMTPAVMLLSFKMIEIDPQGYTTSYGLVAGAGAFLALIGNPLGGAISDRTNIAFGRRRTWILLGPLLGCMALIWIGISTEIWQVLIAWCLAQLFFNFGIAAYTALIPDQVEVDKRGTMSGLIGLTLPIGIGVGMILMMSLNSVPTITKWFIITIIAIIGPIISLYIIRDGKVEKVIVEKKKLTLMEKLNKVYPNPRVFPEFTWAIISKFLLNIGLGVTSYLTIYLVNRLGFSESEATTSVGLINILALAATAFTSVLGGILSDKLKKQKPFLYSSAFVILVGIVLVAFLPNYVTILIAGVVIGLGMGCFTSVDMALVTRILPNQEDAAKDFGLMNVANTLPQSIVPLIAPLLLGIGGWNFFYLFLASFVVLSIFAIKPLPEVGEYRKEKQHILPGANKGQTIN